MAASRHGFMAQRCLIIGTTSEARKAIELIGQHAHANLRILGLIHCGNDRDRIGRFFDEYPVLGTLDTLERFVDLYDVERLVLAAGQESEPILLRQLRPFRYRGIELVDFVALSEELAQEIPLDHINDEWLFMASMNNSRIHIRRLKRLTDMLVALAGLLITAPLAAIAVVLVKLDSPGPILFKQARVGIMGRPFKMYKYRTMHVNSGNEAKQASKEDARIYQAGRWLRKLSIDELPQFVNVLKGDMSLVGPRAYYPDERHGPGVGILGNRRAPRESRGEIGHGAFRGAGVRRDAGALEGILPRLRGRDHRLHGIGSRQRHA